MSRDGFEVPSSDSPLPGLAVARDGTSAVLVDGHYENAQVPNRNLQASRFWVRLPKSRHPYQVEVQWAPNWYAQFERDRMGLPNENVEEAFEELVLAAMGEHLDRHGPIERDSEPSNVLLRVLDLAELIASLADGEPAGPSEIADYLSHKARFGPHFAHQTTLRSSDALRLRVDQGLVLNIAETYTGGPWVFEDGRLRPTPELLQMERMEAASAPPLAHALKELRARPKYRSAAHALEKAKELLGVGDRENAVKEAVTAVEALSSAILERTGGTLGDHIKEFRRLGTIPPPLLKSVESLWGYSSEEPGVRHGRTAPPGAVPADVAFALDLAAAVVLYLLRLSR